MAGRCSGTFLSLTIALLILPIAQPARGQVSGTILDEVTLAPMPGARVGIQATTITTTSGPDGSFDLPDASGTDLWLVGAEVGYFYEPVRVTTPATGVVILMEAVPQADYPNYQFITPYTCGMCHPDQEQQWTGSSMALSGQNRWVYDLYNGTGTAGGMNGFVYTRDSSHAGHNPNSECASCHQPESWITQPFRALEDINNLSQNALHGVSCEVCHKIADVDETKINYPGIYPGAVVFTRPVPGTPTQVEYGVLGDCDYEESYIMRGSYLPEITTSMCGACHQDKNDPDDDGDFEETNGVISQPTFSEWLNGPYGDRESPMYITCVDCHMPSFGESICSKTVMDQDPPIRDPETIRHHGIGELARYLERAIRIDVAGEVEGDYLNAQVILRNVGAGHHVPTGSAIRNMILLVRAWRIEDGQPFTYAGTQVVDDLGGVGDPAEGYYAGMPGKFFGKVLMDENGQWPAFFTEATGVLFDNRIPALGSDTTSYTFEIPPGEGTLAVNARLIYRTAFRELIDEKGWTQDGHGRPLEDLMPPNFGHFMTEGGWMSEAGSVEEDGPSVRSSTSLDQNVPNPASPGTEIGFDLAGRETVQLAIFDTGGRLITDLVDRTLGPGHHSVSWRGVDRSGSAVPSGVYIYRLTVGGRAVGERRLVLIR